MPPRPIGHDAETCVAERSLHDLQCSSASAVRRTIRAMQTAIRCSLMRGGSSKGLYFRKEDLPADEALRDRVLVAAMGSDSRQIDGAGGAHPLTSKVAIVSRSASSDADIDYLFVQVVVGEGARRYDAELRQHLGRRRAVRDRERPRRGARRNHARTRPHAEQRQSSASCSSRRRASASTTTATPRSTACPGTAAPIVCNYLDVAGSGDGQLVADGPVLDVVDGVEVTCIDNGMPVVVMRARDLGARVTRRRRSSTRTRS